MIHIFLVLTRKIMSCYFHLSHRRRCRRSDCVIKSKTQAPMKKIITLLLSSRTKMFHFLCEKHPVFRHSINSMRPWHHNRFLSLVTSDFPFDSFFVLYFFYRICCILCHKLIVLYCVLHFYSSFLD
jgi:hypothetical protein